MLRAYGGLFSACYSNLPAAKGLSKPLADGKSTSDSRFSGARGVAALRKVVAEHSPSCSFLLLTENAATRDALLWTESIKVRLFVTKDIFDSPISRNCEV